MSEPAARRGLVWFVLGAILAAGAALRFWALDHGIPFAVAADEPQIMERVVAMMKTGDFNPHFFDYPGFYLHVQLVVASLRFLAGASEGLWRSLDTVGAADFYLWGRALGALLGTATIGLVYLAGLRWGTPTALLAAGLMAVVPQHVRESHFVLTDVPQTFFTSLTLLLALVAHEKRTAGAFAWAGVAAGLAAACKYPGVVALAMPLVAAAGLAGGTFPRWRAALVATACCAGAFLVAVPHAWLDLPGFLNGFANLASHYRPANTGADASWRLYLIHLRLSLGWPGLVLLFIGLAVAVARGLTGPGRARWWMLVAFGAAYFDVLASRAAIWGRYLLPLYPIACLLVAAAVVALVAAMQRFVSRTGWRRAIAAALVALAMAPPAASAVGFARRIGKVSTQAQAHAWIVEHVAPGASVVLEGQALWLPPGRYRVTHVRRLVDEPLDAYRANGYEYLVASSEVHGAFLAAPERHPEEHAAYRRLFDQNEPLVVFAETPDHPGPQLRVYRIAPASGPGR